MNCAHTRVNIKIKIKKEYNCKYGKTRISKSLLLKFWYKNDAHRNLNIFAVGQAIFLNCAELLQIGSTTKSEDFMFMRPKSLKLF